jgi:phosphoribosylformylglycinamidine synthase PurS subunit
MAQRTETRNAMIKARVIVTLKNGVLDPQGTAIGHALATLGFDGVGEVRQGKVFDLELEAADRAEAEQRLRAMCEKLLANTVIENYSISLE